MIERSKQPPQRLFGATTGFKCLTKETVYTSLSKNYERSFKELKIEAISFSILGCFSKVGVVKFNNFFNNCLII